MCRFYTRFYLNDHTLIIQKKTNGMSDSIDELIQSVQDDPKDKFIFITSDAETTPDAVCYYPDINLHNFNDLPINKIKEITKNNLHYKFIKFENKEASKWFIKLNKSEIFEMIHDTKQYFIEHEYNSINIENFRNELIDTYPSIRHYIDEINFAEEVDDINNKLEGKKINNVLNELKSKSFWDEKKYRMLIEAVPTDVLDLWCKMYIN